MLQESVGLFLYGIATFLSPCSIALISVYLVYVAGLSGSIRRAVVIGCSFVAAMCLVFFVLGYAVSSLIPIDLASSRFFFGLSGVLLILFGLSNLRLLEKLNLIRYAEESLAEQANILKLAALTRLPKYNYVIGSFLFGTIISLALGPCSLSLVLPAILLSLFSAPTPLHGGYLLFMFGLGHSLPVVFLSVALATARREVNKRMIAAGNWVTKLFGPAFIGIGLIMIAYSLGGF
jgi:cytochrome c biogenesis protein CcdA